MKNFYIDNRIIDENNKPFVIAEIGINHEGSFAKAIKMVNDAYKAGAECVKLQLHITEEEMVKTGIIPANAKETIWDIIDRCILTIDEHFKIKKLVDELGMIYLCTPFSKKAADILAEFNVKAFKIGSGECNNYPLLEHIAKFKIPIILSTGMNDIDSIMKSVNILNKNSTDYALLHCTSMYPTPYDKIRLGVLSEYKRLFKDIPIGLSDHSIGIHISLAAVALGATIIEKHFTSTRTWKGPDIPISINPKELEELIKSAGDIQLAKGGSKKILSEEQPTIHFAYACVVSIKDIKKGGILTEDNIWVKRPGDGDIEAELYNDLIGKKVKIDIQKDTQLSWKMIEDDK